MKKRFPLFMALTAMILISFLVVSPVSAQVADGTYKVNYEMKEADSENTSIADGYFTKPATLIVENGVQHIQLTVTGSNYIESLTAPSGPVNVISEDTANRTRVVKFRVDGDLSQAVNMEMHIIVPDMYDMTHTARAVFDVSGLDQAAAAGENESNASDSETEAGAETVENPKTGDDSSIALYALLMVGSAVALFAIWKLRPVRN
ncbi:hypothetical protein CIL05_09555 [Virgibacillus profundi]|uniref:NEAT domain-containing protein n=1 Tax=Virgibacillus profundi TaxID=2024555 RepID=A0A2A2IDF8_9BACI|nr:NEAT domain-containing protein [Virgibacillus profundi]PAV29612.1 hypothetical protein CIL05_09555 [Virgibacillus profundi]PXY53784.1 sortase B protein-sorting domain-containing protein [Virgibacillus profundi]